jgi:hypothetical protein
LAGHQSNQTYTAKRFDQGFFAHLARTIFNQIYCFCGIGKALCNLFVSQFLSRNSSPCTTMALSAKEVNEIVNRPADESTQVREAREF